MAGSRPGRVSWRYALVIAAVIMSAYGVHSAKGQAFAPPEPFPAEKYEAGWRKNPFTLKTAPVAVQRESFAKNLALGSMYDDAEGMTSVVVVNTKTRERTRLKGKDAAPNGMRVEEAVIADTRRDSYAVVLMGGEKATLRYDEAYLKQMAAGGGGGGGANPALAAAAAAKKGNPNAGAMTDAEAPMGAETGNDMAASAPPPPPKGAAAMNQNHGSHPTPMPPGARMPGPGMPGGGRPTVPSRRRLTAPISSPNNQAPAPPQMPTAPIENP